MKKSAFLALAAIIVIASAACTPTKAVRGNMIQDYRLAEAVPGEDTRSDILRKLGSPTTTAPFDENVWYYIGQVTQKRGVFDPEIVEERIIMAIFDEEGVLEHIEDIDRERMDFPVVRRTTPTAGTETSTMQQFFGNLGRFNPQTR